MKKTFFSESNLVLVKSGDGHYLIVQHTPEIGGKKHKKENRSEKVEEDGNFPPFTLSNIIWLDFLLLMSS